MVSEGIIEDAVAGNEKLEADLKAIESTGITIMRDDGGKIGALVMAFQELRRRCLPDPDHLHDGQRQKAA